MTAVQQSSDESGEGLSELRRLLAESTPGVWKLWGMQVMADQDGTSNVDTAVPVAQTYFRDEHDKPRTWDASLIATTHNLLPGLLDAADRAESAEAALATARREADEMRATEAVLRGEIRRAESAIATVDDLVAERDELRGRLAAVEALAVCDQEHGHDDNPARVYGHHGSRRTCIRLKATNEWVYDPAWEVRNG